jgi:hypothetical protein
MNDRHSPLSDTAQRNLESRRALSFENAPGTALDKLRSISRFISRAELGKLLEYETLVKETTGVVGSVADCGVFEGQGLMTYALLLDLLEPYNYQCRVYGFDTFEGDTELVHQDIQGSLVDRNVYKYKIASTDALRESIEIFEESKTLPHIKKIHLVKGDLASTAKSFQEDNPFLFWRIIHLSVNLYKPTLSALRNFIPHLAPGGIVAVHGVNFTTGSSTAIKDYLKESSVVLGRMQVVDYYPNVVFFRVGH